MLLIIFRLAKDSSAFRKWPPKNAWDEIMKYKLHVFPFSNYCEKTLWALDQMGADYTVQTHFPGPHAGRIKKLSDQTAVPVLEDGGHVITGSAAIIAHVLANTPSSDLLPKEHAEEILNWQERLDNVGATLRGTLFYDILPNASEAITTLTMGQKHPLSGYGLFFRAMRPMLMRMLKKGMPDVELARADCISVLDDIAIGAEPSGYLVGDRLTLADIAAAATFFPICMPEMAMGQPRPANFPNLEIWRARWDGHPAIPYLSNIYRQHRAPAHI